MGPQPGGGMNPARNYPAEKSVIFLCRSLRFFKYKQAHALLREPTAENLNNPDWRDESGRLIETRINIHIPPHIELDNEIGVKPLDAADDPLLK
jgi:hypothetical protein